MVKINTLDSEQVNSICLISPAGRRSTVESKVSPDDIVKGRSYELSP